MPNISFDVFFNDDTVNFTASRSKFAPKVKPQWKVRSAPKLAPNEPKTPGVASFAGAQKPKPIQGKVEEIADSKPTSVSSAPKSQDSKLDTAKPSAIAPTANGAPAKKAPPKLKDLPKTQAKPSPPKLHSAPKAPPAAPKKDIPKLKDQAKPANNATRPNRFAREASS